jgi:hypothetical protein
VVLKRIELCPQRREDPLDVTRTGDALTINGHVFDFSELPDGATIPASEVPCEWIAGPVERIAGSVRLTLILPHGPSPSRAVAFPVAIVDPPDGPVALPFAPPPAAELTEEEPADVEG